MPEMWHKPRGRTKPVPVDETHPLAVWMPKGLEPDRGAAGNLNAVGQTVDLYLGDGRGALAVQTEGTYVGTILIEGSVGNRAFVTLASITTSTVITLNVSGLSAVRARMSAYTSGAAYVTLRASVSQPGSAAGLGNETTGVVTSAGMQRVQIFAYHGTSGSVSPVQMVGSAGDGGTSGMIVSPYLYNGASYDRQRANLEGTLLASAARVATTNSADQTNYNGRGVHVFLNVTVAPGVETLTPIIQIKDPISAAYSAILTGAAKSDTGLVVLSAYPGITPASNVAVAMMLGRTWRVAVTHSASGSFTYSVGYAVTV